MKESSGVYAGIAFAFVLWYIVFVLQPFNFWLMMSISTLLLILLSVGFGRPLFRKDEWTWKAAAIGILSAAVLYGLFWLGNLAMILIAEQMPGLLPHRSENLASIYANRGSLPPALIGMLLFFPIGFGEEIFWRGFVQRHFSARFGSRTGFILATLFYTLVHVATGNPVLILAALTCGLFWGALYWSSKSIVPVIISHILWDPFIFVLCPIM